MKKTINAIVFLLICMGFFFPFNVSAKITTITDSEDFATPSDYTFIPKFVNGVTKLETSANYNSTDHFIPNYSKLVTGHAHVLSVRKFFQN